MHCILLYLTLITCSNDTEKAKGDSLGSRSRLFTFLQYYPSSASVSQPLFLPYNFQREQLENHQNLHQILQTNIPMSKAYTSVFRLRCNFELVVTFTLSQKAYTKTLSHTPETTRGVNYISLWIKLRLSDKM